MKYKRVCIDGKNVYRFVGTGYRHGIKQFTVIFHDGTEADMDEIEIRTKAECVLCNIDQVL